LLVGGVIVNTVRKGGDRDNDDEEEVLEDDDNDDDDITESTTRYFCVHVFNFPRNINIFALFEAYTRYISSKLNVAVGLVC
jgi:hypothetical protein